MYLWPNLHIQWEPIGLGVTDRVWKYEGIDKGTKVLLVLFISQDLLQLKNTE